ncbi:MAG: hypothetical protein ACO3O3_08660 [Ilumatobacteraceae bacterium]
MTDTPDTTEWQDSAVYSQCCICEDDIFGFGHNPAPLMDPAGGDNRACTSCNNLVIAARLANLGNSPEGEPQLVFSRNMYHRLKAEYDRAVADQADEFNFTATFVTTRHAKTLTKPLLVDYAGYLLEHIDRQLDKTSNDPRND